MRAAADNPAHVTGSEEYRSHHPSVRARFVRMTWYVRDLDEYRAPRAELGAIWRAVMRRHYPAMALVAVKALVEKEARLEIEATAVLPD